MTKSSHSKLDNWILLACGVYLLSWIGQLISGQLNWPLPLLTAGLGLGIVMVLLHMFRHLGLRLGIVFYVVSVIIEWAAEQTNIMWGGWLWGDLRYSDNLLLGPKLGHVPIFVPLLMGIILWPTFVMVNFVLFRRTFVNSSKDPIYRTIWLCVIYAFVHSWYMFMTDAVCLEFGMYSWVNLEGFSKADVFFGHPNAVRGWALCVFFQMLVFHRVLIPVLGAPKERPLHPIVDAVPLIYVGTMALGQFLQPINQAVGNVMLWTLGFMTLLASYHYGKIVDNSHQE